MCQLIESIKLWNGYLCHIDYHELRANKSRLELWGQKTPIQLKKRISIPQDYRKGLYKCRVVYDREIQDISFTPYKIRSIASLKVVSVPQISYPHKYVDRTCLDDLWAKREKHDEIIIIHDGLVTDAYYYNLVFQIGQTFLTPAQPLLEGVRRQLLLDKNKIQIEKISQKDIQEMEKVHLINALTPLGKIVVEVSHVF